jgi:hypothetical protein
VDIAVYSKMHPHTHAQAQTVHAPASSSFYDGTEICAISLESHIHTHTQNPMMRGDSRTSYSISNKIDREGTNGRRSNIGDGDLSIEDGSAVHGAHAGPIVAEGTKAGRTEEEEVAHRSPSCSPPNLTVKQQLEEIWQTVQLRAVWRPMVSRRSN